MKTLTEPTFKKSIYFWLPWVFTAAHRLSLARGGYSSLQCKEFSLQWLLCFRGRAVGHRGSAVAALGLRCSMAGGSF